jgi:hypothetical protein
MLLEIHILEKFNFDHSYKTFTLWWKQYGTGRLSTTRTKFRKFICNHKGHKLKTGIEIPVL